MIGMNGVTPYRSTAMVADLNQRAANQTARIRASETLMLPSHMISTELPPRGMGLFSRLTMVLEQAQVSHRAAAQAYRINS
jgi:hypothetical protein